MQKNKAFLALGIIIVGVVVVVVALSVFSPGFIKKPYSLVSTSSGFYVGRISNVPLSSFLVLRDVYVLADVRDENNQPAGQQLIPLAENRIWGPKTVYLNKDQVAFKGLVGKCSLIDFKLRQKDGVYKQGECPQIEAAEAAAAAEQAPTPAPKK